MVYWIQLEFWFIIEDFPVCCVFVFIIFYFFAVNSFQRSSELGEGLANSGEMDEVFFFPTKSYIKTSKYVFSLAFFYSTGDKHKQHFKVNSPHSLSAA